jgi:hypothetical protein
MAYTRCSQTIDRYSYILMQHLLIDHMSSSPPLSTPSGYPSNHQSVAQILSTRGFDWRRVKLQDVLTESSDISFKTEWEKFVSVVQIITSNVSSKQQSENRSIESTEQQSKETKETSKKPLEADVAWTNHFMKVLSNAGNPERSEEEFKNVLFDALRDSLSDFVHPIASNASDGNLIVLRSEGSVQVGFGKQVNREKLGFNNEYALSKNSQPDHGCFVFGTGSTKRNSPGTNETLKSFYDLTAVVELKLEKTSCKISVDEKTKEIEKPDFEKGLAPLGQTMLYAMDIWHCLARRGVSVKSLPVVVLAGKAKMESTAKNKDSNRICCLEAHIEIPEYCGDAFEYTIDRLVTFDETQELCSDELKSKAQGTISWNSRDGRAIAIYIKTMRAGLENATVIMEKYNQPNSIFPISLFCHNLLKTETNAELIASPIPLEEHLRSSGIRIHQGELFRLNDPQKEYFSGFMDLFWFVDSKLPNDCIVKVSCASVHNIFINHAECKEALKVLYETCVKDDVFRDELSKVLLGYCCIKSSLSFVTIMKDLQAGGKNFKVLEHRTFNEAKLQKLWSAFSDLVIALLLPMADVNVIHLDIRATAKVTHNILFCEETKGDDFTIELRLIDFDSVVVRGFTGSENKDAVCWKDLQDTVVSKKGWESSYRYLFWQVLWIAFTWHPFVSENTNAKYFVRFLFSDDEDFSLFRNWLGTVKYDDLRNKNFGTITAETITKTLETLAKAFRGET